MVMSKKIREAKNKDLREGEVGYDLQREQIYLQSVMVQDM